MATFLRLLLHFPLSTVPEALHPKARGEKVTAQITEIFLVAWIYAYSMRKINNLVLSAMLAAFAIA